jgi:hypothetical protein
MTRLNAVLLSLFLVSLVATQALAVESGLAGVRLSETAIQLLSDPAFGPPAYLGPVGLSISREAAAPTPAFGTPGVASLPTTSSLLSRSPFSSTPTTTMTPRPPGAPATAAPGAATAAPATPEPVMLWLYKRQSSTLLGIELSANGVVTGVIVDGSSPSAAETARGIRPGASYEQVLAAYGYPSETVNEGQTLILKYLYDGLTFRLSNMRVVAMRLSANPLAPIPGGGAAGRAPGAVGPVAPGAPRAGGAVPTGAAGIGPRGLPVAPEEEQ